MPDGDCLWIVLCETCARARGAQHDRRYTNHGVRRGLRGSDGHTDPCDDCGSRADPDRSLFAIRAASAC